ncbi:MAG: DNRLRE domain-containing protein [Clostridia bacterium]|nr:DNRLRE domain-containing protein [Clostridia bacterium]
MKYSVCDKSLLQCLVSALLIISMLASPFGMIMTGYADAGRTVAVSSSAPAVGHDIWQTVPASEKIRAVSEEKDLFSKIYVNSDGSRTLEYYASPVKFISDDGNVQDISLKLKNILSGDSAGSVAYPDSRTSEWGDVPFSNHASENAQYPVTEKTDVAWTALSHYIDIAFPQNLNKGVALSYNGNSVKVSTEEKDNISEYSASLETNKSENAIRYASKNNGGQKVRLPDYVFGLTYAGIKQEIIVPSKKGPTEYSFIVDLEGLKPEEVNSSDGNYYLLKDQSGNICGRIGEAIVSDTDGKNNKIGKMTLEIHAPAINEDMASAFSESALPETENGVHLQGSGEAVTAERAKYLLTISLDEAYSNNSVAAYPLTIETTLELFYSIPAPIQFNSLEDITVNQNAATDSPYSGTLYVGRAGEDYGKMRSVVRFPNLNLLGIHTDDIISANLYMRDLMCYGTSLFVDCYEYKGILPTESFSVSNMTWSLVDTETSGYEADGEVKSSKRVSYSDGYATGHEYAFDIAFAVKDWINGIGHGAPSTQHAVVFKSRDAHENTSLVQYVCFGSSDRAVHKPYLVIEYSGRETGPDTSDAGWMDENSVVEVNIPSSGSRAYFGFTPETTGIYSFEGFGQGSTADTNCRLYNCYGELLCESDTDGNGLNYNITYHLRQGITYYYEAGLNGAATGTYMAAFTEALPTDAVRATELDIGYSAEITTLKAYEVSFIRLMPEKTAEHLLFSSETNSDPVIWIYDSDYNQVTMNDDGAGNGNFKAETMLTANATYYAVIGFDRDRCGSLRLNTLSDPELEDGEYYIRNYFNENLLTSFITGTGRLPEIYAFNSQLDQRWTISSGPGGYFFDTIGSDDFRLKAVSGLGIGNAGVSLINNLSDSDCWKIYEDASHRVLIESLRAPGNKLAIIQTDNGIDLGLVPINKTENSHSSWRMIKAIYGSKKFVGPEELPEGSVNCMGYALFINSSLGFMTDRTVENYLLTEYPSGFVSYFSEEVRAHVDNITKNAFETWMNDHMFCYEFEADFDNNGQNRILNPNQYRIVLRAGLQPYRDCDITDEVGHYDFHFWYQTYDGTWANKHGDGGTPTHLAEEETPFTNDSSGWYCSFYGVDFPCFYSGQIYSYIISLS